MGSSWMVGTGQYLDVAWNICYAIIYNLKMPVVAWDFLLGPLCAFVPAAARISLTHSGGTEQGNLHTDGQCSAAWEQWGNLSSSALSDPVLASRQPGVTGRGRGGSSWLPQGLACKEVKGTGRKEKKETHLESLMPCKSAWALSFLLFSLFPLEPLFPCWDDSLVTPQFQCGSVLAPLDKLCAQTQACPLQGQSMERLLQLCLR